MPKKDKALITIGITCFNAQDTIARAIESALKQDWSNFEIIIVDDHSTDNSVEIIQDIKRKHSQVQLYCHERNLGYPSALNTIITHAKGEYIAFFDDDDDNEPNRLTKQYNRLHKFKQEHSNSLVLCYSNRRVIEDGKEKPSAFVYAIGRQAPEPRGFNVADFLLWGDRNEDFVFGLLGSCTMFAETLQLRQFPFDTQFRRCAEWDRAIRIAFEGGYFIAVDEPLVIQYKTKTSDKSGKKPLKYNLMLRKKYQSYLKQKNIYWVSILLAHTKFYYFRQKPVFGFFYKLLAFSIPPFRLFFNKIRKQKRFV